MNKPVPEAIAAWLGTADPPAGEVLLCTDTDLDSAGHYREGWLIVAAESLFAFTSAGGRFTPVKRIPLAAILSARADVRVGSGVLEVELQPGLFDEVLHFSNLHAEKFARIAQKLVGHRQGRSIVVTPEDESDHRACQRCGRMLAPDARGLCPRCLNKGQILLRLLGLLRPYWAQSLLILGLLIVGVGLDLAPPWLTRVLIDNVLGDDPAPTPFGFVAGLLRLPGAMGMLLLVVSTLAGARLVRIAVTVGTGRLGSVVGTRLTYDLRVALYRRLQELSVSYYDRNQVGNLMTRVSQDTDELHGFILQITSGFLVNIFLLIGIGAVLFTLDARLALYTLIPTPFVVASTYVFWTFVLPRYHRYWDSRSKVASVLYAALSGVRVVKAFAQEEREIGRFDGLSRRLRESRLDVDQSANTFYPVVGFVFSLGGLIVWYAGGGALLGREPGMTLGTLMAFIGYLGIFYGPLNQLTYVSQWLTTFVTAANRAFDILDTQPEVATAPDALPLPDIRGAVEFAGVTFGYERHYPVLNSVNLSIKPGEMIGIVGRSGSGKTTIVNLICRFYDATSGAVRIDGVDVRRIRVDDLRRQIGLVLQEPYLFRGTIRENIAYGRPDATTDEVVAAAKAANAHDFIVRLPDGYDTRLGENGSGLSGGERQRVSIARAILCDPKILILDEATSAVDTESERAIQEALARLTRGRTTIAIAHRLSTLRNSDRIVVVDRGEIKEVGSHEELLAQGGIYHRLVQIQLQLNKGAEPAPAAVELQDATLAAA